MSLTRRGLFQIPFAFAFSGRKVEVREPPKAHCLCLRCETPIGGHHGMMYCISGTPKAQWGNHWKQLPSTMFFPTVGPVCLNGDCMSWLQELSRRVLA